jgi:hypothetical protein
MRGANGEAWSAALDQIEIDKLSERRFERRGRIVAGALGAERIKIAGMGERIRLKETGNAAVIVDQEASRSLTPENASWNFQIGFCSIRFQNSVSRARRSCGALPAIRLALMAPIDVPMIQSGSIPASCSA